MPRLSWGPVPLCGAGLFFFNAEVAERVSKDLGFA